MTPNVPLDSACEAISTAYRRRGFDEPAIREQIADFRRRFEPRPVGADAQVQAQVDRHLAMIGGIQP